ncbi:MAG: type II toxin-antitoxin system VapC family toxin [Acidimicrobiia bacterium]|nr:type II toxin-antitoxin system VapC family toxin [Acidimicrobiia bacterium]
MTLPGGVLDTCVIIELGGRLDAAQLPDDQVITAVTLGELSVGPLVADDVGERSRRQLRLQAMEIEFAEATLPYDAAAARIFGRVMAAALRRGRRSRVRVSDYQIAAIAIANDLPLYTINTDDFARVDGLTLMPVRLESS